MIDELIDDGLQSSTTAEQLIRDEEVTSDTSNDITPDCDDQTFDSDPAPIAPVIGDNIQVFWPLDSTYYPGTITDISDTGYHTVAYDDGDSEALLINEENWRFSRTTLSSATTHSLPRLPSSEQQTLQLLLDTFGNKPFMRHHAQGFDQACMDNAYAVEEDGFKKTVKLIPRDQVPANSNVINSHVIYKVKINDDQTLKLKDRIAPHGNEDSLRSVLKSDCSMCSPTGVRIVIMISSLFGWRIHKLDALTAFLQTGAAERDVYVVPRRECRDRRFLWLLLAAAYGLVNANAKWQTQSDQLIQSLGLTQCPLVPQLFYKLSNGRLSLVVAKIVDDLMVTGEPGEVESFQSGFGKIFKLGTVCSGPGRLRFFGLSVIQAENYSTTVDGDDKLHALETHALTRNRRRQPDDPLNELEKSSFMSVNSSLCWLGMASSPLCSFYDSYLHQKLPSCSVSSIALEARCLTILKRFGSTICYPRPPIGSQLPISVCVFADAGRQSDYGQLSTIAGVLLGSLQQESTFYTLSWSSRKSRRPVRSIGSAETLAVGEAIDEGKLLKEAISLLLQIDVQLIIVTDSKDLYNSLSTQRNATDKSIRADVNVIRYEFETNSVNEMVWVPGRVNLADPGTKRDSQLTDALQLLLFTGRIPLDLSAAESRSTYLPLG